MSMAANSPNLKRGYFVSSFNGIGSLDLISIIDAPGNFFYVVLNSRDPSVWVEINFVVLDLSTVTGCSTHNLYNGTVNSLTNMARATFSFSSAESSELIVGLANIRAFNGTF